MTRNDDRTRLRHMLDAAEKAVEFAAGRSRRDLDTDEMLALALVRLIEVMGEAARGLSPALREAHPSVPWKQIVGTRDRLIHGYFDVDVDVIWAIVTGDLPAVIGQLQDILVEVES